MLLALSDIDSCGDESDCECDELGLEVILTVMVELTETW